MFNLYSGSSLIRLNEQYKVRCYWFCVDRGVNESFTEQEIKSLETYLATKEICLEIKEVEELPVDGEFVGLVDSPLGGGAGFIKLNEYDGYDLPFKIWGFYDSKDSEDLVYSPEKEEVMISE